MRDPLLELIGALRAKRIKFLVIGGVAILLYGVRRSTFDLDFLVPKDPKNLEKLLGLLCRLKFKKVYGLSKEKEGAGFLGSLRTVRPDLLVRRTAIRVVNGETIDILFAKSDELFSFWWSRRREKTVQRVKVPLLDLEDLIQLKEESGRHQDLCDVEELKRLLRSR